MDMNASVDANVHRVTDKLDTYIASVSLSKHNNN